MPPILSLTMWVSLSIEVRNRIRAAFSIPRSSHVVVSDTRLETDGTTPEDFKALTVEKMRSFVNDGSTDFHKLFDMVVAKVTEDLIQEKTPKSPEVISVPEGMPITVVVEPIIKPKKNAKNTTQK